MDGHDPRIAFLTGFIEANLRDPQLSVVRIACEVHLSQSRLRQLMKQHLHTGLKQYIRQRRLSRARELLQASFLSVKEVMAKVGLNDPSHFSKDYKQQFKIAPHQDRVSGKRDTVTVPLSKWPIYY